MFLTISLVLVLVEFLMFILDRLPIPVFEWPIHFSLDNRGLNYTKIIRNIYLNDFLRLDKNPLNKIL
jgi:hypothetical protein